MEQHLLHPPPGREGSLRDHCAWARRTPEASVTLPPPASHWHNFFVKARTRPQQFLITQAKKVLLRYHTPACTKCSVG
ncbi:uncharacterized protein LOC142589701 [Dermacentor variabilis]|uniref:uncharacterized protein LOC142589701 n=1 Tax=Dermacentor variabilis TaxID=34621 RepID=UPI003F5B9ACA